MRKIIKFNKRPRYDSTGRNGFIMTTGIEIADLGASEYLMDDPVVEAAVTLHPLDSRGNVSEACRLSIARSALPAVIAALRELLPDVNGESYIQLTQAGPVVVTETRKALTDKAADILLDAIAPAREEGEEIPDWVDEAEDAALAAESEAATREHEADPKIAKVFYSDGSGNARPNDPSITPGWYYQIDMASPVGPFDRKVEATAAAQDQEAQ